MSALHLIHEVEQGNLSVLKSEPWLKFLFLNDSTENLNMDNFDRVGARTKNAVFDYVKKTLQVLEKIKITLTPREYKIVEQVLSWSEVAKCGNRATRSQWRKKGYNLRIHNLGSAQIYKEYANGNKEELICTLIRTHGYLGQIIRGESKMHENVTIYEYVKKHNIDFNMKHVLQALNQCIIEAISETLYQRIQPKLEEKIELILQGKFKEMEPEVRLKGLRSKAIANGEDFTKEWNQLTKAHPELKAKMIAILDQNNLWYVEAATSSYRLEHLLKLLIIADIQENSKVKDISFIDVMNTIYYDYQGKKRVNVYKARIIEHLLDSIPMEQLLKKNHENNLQLSNEHLEIKVVIEDDIARICFVFSKMAEALIEFCMASEGQGSIYDKAIIMLYDLFGLRRDAYDRFNNEDHYLEQMNQSIGFKEILLNYVAGERIVDIGPGGGALMDRLEERYPDKQILGIDISENVIEELTHKKNREHKKWEVYQGNALNLKELFGKDPVDTIILSSIVHELFSYIEFDGKRYNYETLKTAFRSMFEVLNVGGRICIRDGVMTEPKDMVRQIRFKNVEDRQILDDYCHDFKGREVRYTELAKDLVSMKVNDAMEFLYTYTWGKDSYSHEIEEQFGYYTPTEYVELFKELFGEKIRIVEIKHYLQEGYAENLLPKVDFMDEEGKNVQLPDSTLILVIEKVAEQESDFTKIKFNNLDNMSCVQ